MKNERGVFSNIKDRSVNYGNGVVGPSHLDKARADQTFGRRLQHLGENLSSIQELMRKKVILAPLAASILLSACGEKFYPFGIGAPSSQSAAPTEKSTPVPTASATPKPSEAAGATPTPKPSESAKAAATEGVKIENLGTLADVARKYGVDSYTQNAANWEWAPGEEGKAAHLKAPDNGAVSRINLNGAVVEGYIDAPEMSENTKFNAIIILAHPNQKVVDVRGGTLRFSNDADGLFNELLGKLLAKEAREQPGTIIYKACPPADLTPGIIVGTRNLGTLADVAARVGRDSFSRNANNWEWAPGEIGKAAVLKTPDGRLVSRIELSGNLVAEGYVDANERIENTRFDAISFLADSTQGFVDSRGLTVRDFEDKDKGFLQLIDQHTKVENRTQPGTIVLLLRECALE